MATITRENNEEPVWDPPAFIWKQEVLNVLHFLTFTQHHGGAFYLHLIINVRTDFLFDGTVCSMLNRNRSCCQQQTCDVQTCQHPRLVNMHRRSNISKLRLFSRSQLFRVQLIVLTRVDFTTTHNCSTDSGADVLFPSFVTARYRHSTHPTFWPVHSSLTSFNERTEVSLNVSQHKNNHKAREGGSESVLWRKTHTVINPYLSLD